LAAEKEEFVYRSYLAMGQANILNEAKIKPTSSPGIFILNTFTLINTNNNYHPNSDIILIYNNIHINILLL